MAKQAFLTEMEARLKEFDEKMARLAARPKLKSERARQEREKTYFFLKARRDELRERLRQAEAAPDGGWSRFKASAELIYEDMARHMDETSERIEGPEHVGLY